MKLIAVNFVREVFEISILRNISNSEYPAKRDKQIKQIKCEYVLIESCIFGILGSSGCCCGCLGFLFKKSSHNHCLGWTFDKTETLSSIS